MAKNVDFTRCKGFGHNWDDCPRPPYAAAAPTGFVQAFFRCSRCGTEKTYTLERSTGIGKPRYHYQKEYKLEQASRAEWKLIWTLNRKRLHR